MAAGSRDLSSRTEQSASHLQETASALEEAARRLGENAEALLSRVNRSVEVRGPDRRRKAG